MTQSLSVSGQLTVSLNGVDVYTTYATFDGRTKTFACDVTAFAGQSDVELRFSAGGASDALFTLDAIQFSPIIVPEPSALVLLGVALLSLAGYGWRCRRKKSSKSGMICS
jgi:hypothetical protein